MKFRFSVPALCVLSALATACGGRPQQSQSPADVATQGPLRPVPVTDQELISAVRKLLTDDQISEARTNLLAGVTRHLLARAEERFRAGHEDAGVRTLNGALYLMRAGEFRIGMLEGQSVAINQGAMQAARTGNVGRAQALYGLLKETLPQGSERNDVLEHLQALNDFVKSTRQGALRSAGAEQRARVEESLAVPSLEARDAARDATVHWIREALQWNASEQSGRGRGDNEEAMEALRALRTGGEVLSALYLRHVDPLGAALALDMNELAEAIPPALRDRLERAGEDDHPEAWHDLFRFFHAEASRGHGGAAAGDGTSIGAAFGAALGLYRSAPDAMFGVQPISIMLLDFGMPEVAPALLASVLSEGSDVEELSWALGVTLRAIVEEDELGDLSSARRVFQAAQPLMDLARLPSFQRRVNPNAARLAYVMGAVETRNAELSKALVHIEAAVQEEPSIFALRKLASIERQQGELDRAIRSLQAVVDAAGKQADARAEGDALVQIYEIERDRGQAERAQSVLRRALGKALDARELLRDETDAAEAERLLARILEHYGQEEAARRATERAYDASWSDQLQLAATVTDAARRALTHGDLRAGRRAVRQAIEAHLPPDDTVYAALWLQLLEGQLNVASDGTAFEAFTSAEDANGWPAQLRKWGLGQIDDGELAAAASGPIEAVEARFYVAMSQQAAGAGQAAELEAVAKSKAVDLVEVTIARDLLAMQAGKVNVSLPDGIRLP